MKEEKGREFVDTAKVNRARTICEVHREVYDVLAEHYGDTPHFKELADKLQEAYTMAKKMNLKLKQYKHNYDNGWWEKSKADVVKEKLNKRKKRNNNASI